MSFHSTPLHTSTPSSKSILMSEHVRYVNFNRRRKVEFIKMAGKEGDGKGDKTALQAASELLEFDQDFLDEFLNIQEESKKARWFIAGWRYLKCTLEEAEDWRNATIVIGGKLEKGENVDELFDAVWIQLHARKATKVHKGEEQTEFEKEMNSMRIEGEQKQDEDTEDEAEVVEHKHVRKTPVKPRSGDRMEFIRVMRSQRKTV
jgi:hypothetical protein